MKQLFLTFTLLVFAQIALAQTEAKDTERRKYQQMLLTKTKTIVLNINNKEAQQEKLTTYLRTYFEKIREIRRDEVNKKLIITHIMAFTEQEMRDAIREYGFLDADIISYEFNR